MIDPDELEQTAVDFMLTSRESGVMHEGSAVGKVVASFVTTPALMQAFFGAAITGAVPVGWILGVKLADPAVFRRVAEGQLAMFSIQGTADREELDG